MKWMQEAETTVNVLMDASQREGVQQDVNRLRQLKVQLQVRFSVVSFIGYHLDLHLLI